MAGDRRRHEGGPEGAGRCPRDQTQGEGDAAGHHGHTVGANCKLGLRHAKVGGLVGAGTRFPGGVEAALDEDHREQDPTGTPCHLAPHGSDSCRCWVSEAGHVNPRRLLSDLVGCVLAGGSMSLGAKGGLS
jgi:hypothetical protein